MYAAIIRKRVRETFQALDEGNYEVALAGMAPRFEHIFAGTHALGGTRHTPAAMRHWFERLFRLNKQLVFEIRHIAVSGWPWDTTAVVEWTDRAVLAAGGDYINRGVHVIRLRWGRVVSIHAYLDTSVWEQACQRMAACGISEAVAAPIED